ncbi:dihydrodipicolinate synthase family protein [Prosthecomicrobium sp. N25]|uniref:dihydrodipicolinate synthase family protein n=1 Tax=Prosthecomicrobium sp. N25 TaxID=3129254 RepID=UPI0030775EF1
MTKLSGVFPVLPTPFAEDGSIDPAALGPIVAFVLEAGADGVVYPGMASEVETLAPEERALLVAEVGRLVGGRVPLIVGASDADPGRAAARAEEGRRAGARAAMIMAPAGNGPDVAKHVAFYAAVAAATDLPIMLQNAPQPMGAGLSPEAVAEIVRAVPAIRFVKEETLPCGQHVTALLAAVGDRLDGVFGGAGARYVMDELARGAAGTMPASELTDVHVALVRAFRAGDRAIARRLYARSLPLLLVQAVFRVRLTKAVLAARGLLRSTHARAAGPRFDAHDGEELEALVDEAADLFAIHPVTSPKARHAAA